MKQDYEAWIKRNSNKSPYDQSMIPPNKSFLNFNPIMNIQNAEDKRMNFE